jgi:hypothetical protein
MPVLEWGEEELRDSFEVADQWATMSEAACLVGHWPDGLRGEWANRWPGLKRIQLLTDHAPDELRKPRTSAGIRGMFFVSFVWAQTKLGSQQKG